MDEGERGKGMDHAERETEWRKRGMRGARKRGGERKKEEKESVEGNTNKAGEICKCEAPDWEAEARKIQ